MDEKPTIVFLVNCLGVGGSETKLVKLANSFVEAGENVEVAYLDPPDTLAQSFDARITVTHLRRRFKYSFEALRRFRRLVKGRNVVIVAVYLYPLLYAVPVARFRAEKHLRVLCLINTTELLGNERLHGRLFAPLLRKCDRLIYGCKLQQELWSDRYRLPVEKSTHIYNGVDEIRFAPTTDLFSLGALKREWAIPDGSFVIGSVGRLAEEKNYEVLITALAKLKNKGIEAYLIFVGEGPEKSSLRQFSQALFVSDQVRFLGLLHDTRPAVSAMDVFVLPSRSETFSNAALEAMAMAKPVVLSDVGGASEMVEDGTSGMLFESGNTEQLVGHLRSLFNSETLRKSLGCEARKRVIASFKDSKMIEGYRRELIDTDAN